MPRKTFRNFNSKESKIVDRSKDEGGEMNSALDEELASGEEISSERTNNGDFQGREISATVNDQKPIGEGSDEFSGEVDVGHRTLARGPDDPAPSHEGEGRYRNINPR